MHLLNLARQPEVLLHEVSRYRAREVAHLQSPRFGQRDQRGRGGDIGVGLGVLLIVVEYRFVRRYWKLQYFILCHFLFYTHI